jgi:4,5-DOPA dioxygenase extradiol
MNTTLMPAAFIGHGNPMNALEDNLYTRAWREFGASIPTPRAILVISAHWYVGSTLVTAMEAPRTIHDFYGFPQELFDVEYRAPGSPSVAQEIVDVVKPRWVGLDGDGWGLDHGAWSVLAHLFPAADIPVLQLSINSLEDFDEHVELGARLAPLRAEGVFILGSGNVVHNLRLVQFSLANSAFDWTMRFNEECTAMMTSDPTRTRALANHPDYPLAVPTPDHFLPLAPIVGLAAAAGRPARILVDGYVAGSLSMTSFRVD